MPVFHSIFSILPPAGAVWALVDGAFKIVRGAAVGSAARAGWRARRLRADFAASSSVGFGLIVEA